MFKIKDLSEVKNIIDSDLINFNCKNNSKIYWLCKSSSVVLKNTRRGYYYEFIIWDIRDIQTEPFFTNEKAKIFRISQKFYVLIKNKCFTFQTSFNEKLMGPQRNSIIETSFL